VLKLPIYLDNHATTRTDPRVVEAMLPFFTEIYGNAASISHQFGWEASEAVERARQQVAGAIGAEPKEIVFTSGATESNNLAIKGVALAMKRKGNHLVTSAAEHRAVLDAMKRLGREGWELTVLPCDRTGRVTAQSVADAVSERTILVSIMAANNEVGTLNPICEIGRLCHDRGVIFHTDATQAVGKIPLHVLADNVDLLSISAHKTYGPKGIGALYVRRRDPQVRLLPQLDGGGHERGMRSGTPAVPLIVGLGTALELAARELPEESQRLLSLRERLHAGIVSRVSDTCLNGHPTERLPANLNLSFAYVDGEALMMAMRDVAVSSGAACTAANPEPSHVLLAMGRDEEMARASLRFGLGRFSTIEEIEFAIDAVDDAVKRLRVHSAAWTGRAGSPSFDRAVGRI
jgi:cysteine desulfurase